jgi:hypothetical protein
VGGEESEAEAEAKKNAEKEAEMEAAGIASEERQKSAGEGA